MKNVTKYLLLLVAGVAMTACVQDLNQTPIDKNSTTSFNQDACFTKCYQTLALTGQEGPAGDGDIDDLDEGTSAFYRLMWELNEFPTDEGWWIWNDVGLADIRVMNWNGENDLVKGLYYRFNIDVKLCNHFLANADDNLDKTAAQKAEVRFLRALNYSYLLDMFYAIPFTEEDAAPFFKQEEFPNDNPAYPRYMTRPEMFDWLVNELTDVIEYLPANRLSTYRVDKTAANLLLARLYLNAPIYTSTDGKTPGEAQWAKAKEYAEAALNSNYKLYSEHTTHQFDVKDSTGAVIGQDNIMYTAYQKLFMADNDINGAQNEAVLMIYQDGKYCRAYGGIQFLVAATRDANMFPWGTSAQWKCFRSSPEFVYKFVPQTKAASTEKDEYHMREVANDDRAILCSWTSYTTNKWKLTGGQSAEFYDSWSCPKFSSVYSTAKHPSESVGSDSEWPDTDIPLMRIAEAYLIKAEAAFRLGDPGTAATMINELRTRAQAKQVTSGDITEEFLCDEWCREFWGEGRRRTDLIRFNRFAGAAADANSYAWEGRAGANSGSFKSGVEDKWNWFPVPSSDKLSNPNFKIDIETAQNPLDGGDGYGYGSAE